VSVGQSRQSGADYSDSGVDASWESLSRSFPKELEKDGSIRTQTDIKVRELDQPGSIRVQTDIYVPELDSLLSK
jgi:hypothetical protein